MKTLSIMTAILKTTTYPNWIHGDTRYPLFEPSNKPSTVPTINNSYKPTISFLQLQGGNGLPQIKTITEDDSANTPINKDSTNNNVPTETLTIKPVAIEAEYNPIVDTPWSCLMYVPLHQKNKHWGDPCEPEVIYEAPECFWSLWPQFQ